MRLVDNFLAYMRLVDNFNPFKLITVNPGMYSGFTSLPDLSVYSFPSVRVSCSVWVSGDSGTLELGDSAALELGGSAAHPRKFSRRLHPKFFSEVTLEIFLDCYCLNYLS